MAPARPYWKGYLKLSLVSCPVAVYTATSSTERVAFRQINKKTGNRLKQQMVDEETGEVVQSADKGRGYEVAKQTYLAIEDDEIDAIAIESNHTIDIGNFVPRTQIDERCRRDDQVEAGRDAAPSGKSNVIDLMDALRRSLGTAPKADTASRSKKPRKRVAGQGEMLLPISGKGAAKEAAKKQAATAKPSKTSTRRKAG